MVAALPTQLVYTPDLPGYEQQGAIVTALTQSVKDILEEMQLKGQLFQLWMDDPDLCDPKWLDFLAYLSGWGGDYWDGSWDVGVKRNLIKNSNWIWINQGTPQLLTYLFSVFGLTVTLKRSSGWILGVTKFNQSLNSDWRNLKLQVPNTYKTTTREYQLVKQLVDVWVPCWINFVIEISP